MTVLIVGASGQVGQELLLRARTFPVKGFDRSALDIVDASAVQDAIDRHSARAIINAAAYTAVDKAELEHDAAFAANRDGAAILARSCAEAGIPLLHLSTDYVFDGKSPVPYTIDSPASPIGTYGKSKWEGEQAIRTALPQHLIVRVSWVFGAHGNNFVRTMLRLGRERPELRVVADQHGAPTHAGAIADTLLSLAQRHLDGESLPWGTWHYTGMPVVSWQQFAVSIFEEALAAGMTERLPVVHGISTAEYLTPAQRPANSALDTTLTAEVLGIVPRPWIDGLREVLREWKSTV